MSLLKIGAVPSAQMLEDNYTAPLNCLCLRFYGKPPLKHVVPIWKTVMAAARMRELSVYDGQELVGTVKVSEDDKARAFDRDGKRIGSYPSFAPFGLVQRRSPAGVALLRRKSSPLLSPAPARKASQRVR